MRRRFEKSKKQKQETVRTNGRIARQRALGKPGGKGLGVVAVEVAARTQSSTVRMQNLIMVTRRMLVRELAEAEVRGKGMRVL